MVPVPAAARLAPADGSPVPERWTLDGPEPYAVPLPGDRTSPVAFPAGGDRALVLAQRLLEVVTHAPEIEEDLAVSNLALDLIGQARALYTYAGEIEGPTPDGTIRDEDHYAYWRDQHEFVNPLLVELPNGDFAHVITRQFLHDAFALPYWQAMVTSTDATLSAIAGKAVNESTYHRDHARLWVLRLGDGTEESRTRMNAALERVAPYVDELFTDSWADRAAVAAGIGVLPSSLRSSVLGYVGSVLAEATLDPLPEPAWHARGGREGLHSEVCGFMLAEMQHLARSHPGATW